MTENQYFANRGALDQELCQLIFPNMDVNFDREEGVHALYITLFHIMMRRCNRGPMAGYAQSYMCISRYIPICYLNIQSLRRMLSLFMLFVLYGDENGHTQMRSSDISILNDALPDSLTRNRDGPYMYFEELRDLIGDIMGTFHETSQATAYGGVTRNHAFINDLERRGVFRILSNIYRTRRGLHAETIFTELEYIQRHRFEFNHQALHLLNLGEQPSAMVTALETESDEGSVTSDAPLGTTADNNQYYSDDIISSVPFSEYMYQPLRMPTMFSERVSTGMPGAVREYGQVYTDRLDPTIVENYESTMGQIGVVTRRRLRELDARVIARPLGVAPDLAPEEHNSSMIVGSEVAHAEPIHVESESYEEEDELTVAEVSVSMSETPGGGSHTSSSTSSSSGSSLSGEEVESIPTTTFPLFMRDDTRSDSCSGITSVTIGVIDFGITLYETHNPCFSLAYGAFAAGFWYYTPINAIRNTLGTLLGQGPRAVTFPDIQMPIPYQGNPTTPISLLHAQFLGTVLPHTGVSETLQNFIHSSNLLQRRGFDRYMSVEAYPDAIETLYRMRPAPTLVDDGSLLEYLVTRIMADPTYSTANGYNYLVLHDSARVAYQIIMIQRLKDEFYKITPRTVVQRITPGQL